MLEGNLDSELVLELQYMFFVMCFVSTINQLISQQINFKDEKQNYINNLISVIRQL